MLTDLTGANRHVVELFAFFHDSRRINEHVDDGHGARGAALARRLKVRYFDATDEEVDLLDFACVRHSDGLTKGDVPVLTCCDADRLDLGRVGITPRVKYLCTEASRRQTSMDQVHRRAHV